MQLKEEEFINRKSYARPLCMTTFVWPPHNKTLLLVSKTTRELTSQGK